MIRSNLMPAHFGLTSHTILHDYHSCVGLAASADCPTIAEIPGLGAEAEDQ